MQRLRPARAGAGWLAGVRRGWRERAWYLALVGDAQRCMQGGPESYLERQRWRQAALLDFARQRSPFYRARYAGLPANAPWESLPPVTKPELMANFERWLVDPSVSRAAVESFLADRSLVGERLLGRYAVWSTSGSSGLRTDLVHEGRAVAVYRALTLARGWLPWLTAGTLARRLGRRDRTAVVVPTGAHLVSNGLTLAGRRQRPWPFNQIQLIDLAQPLPALVAELDAFQPVEMVSYPTGLDLLADEQAAGRLRLRPVLVACGAEHLTEATRRKVEAAFGCPLRENYGASEFPRFAWSCRLGSLHVSADWVVLEPVDADYRPVPPGQRSHTALLTNLVNRLQPIVRYDLGDAIVMPPEPCACGNPLPVVRVEGRQNETLWLEGPPGAPTPLLPHPLLKVVETTPGVRRFQIVQTGASRLTVRLEAEPGQDRAAVWQAVADGLHAYLARHGLGQAELLLSAEAPVRDPVSGKFRLVSSAL
jgi:phenylacetate-coenzyme A ligase PaaK-like adenylate-forming protein